jgi:hypothetical protein
LLKGVLRPLVLWVAASKLFAHLWVPVLPKACEVPCDLNGTVCGREKVDRCWYLETSYVRCLSHAEQLLNACLEGGRCEWRIPDRTGLAGGEGDVRRGYLIQLPTRIPREKPFQPLMHDMLR